MAEQHGMQPEHHAHKPEKVFFDEARQRIDQALKRVAEIEASLSKNVGHRAGAETDRPASG